MNTNVFDVRGQTPYVKLRITSDELRISGGTPAPDYIIGERNGRFLNSTRGRSSPSTVLP